MVVHTGYDKMFVCSENGCSCSYANMMGVSCIFATVRVGWVANSALICQICIGIVVAFYRNIITPPTPERSRYENDHK